MSDSSPYSSPHPAIVTVWYVNAACPAQVLNEEPSADRGFGRKLLAQLNPAWPITPIGEFPLNRSSTPGPNEFYIAGYSGVAVLQTYAADVGVVSAALPHVRGILPAADVFVFAEGVDSDFAGFAHFSGSKLKRAFTATRETVLEDSGLPEPFEAPYWAGETAEQLGGISLPFAPKDLARAAQEAWLGVPISPAGPDIHVVGYAVDGRPEPKVAPAAAAAPTKSVAEVAARFAEKDADYDDYDAATERDGEGDEFAQLADASLAAAQRIARGVLRRLVELKDGLIERIRHSDR